MLIRICPIGGAFASVLPHSLAQILILGSVTTAPLEGDSSMVGGVVARGGCRPVTVVCSSGG
jgi:hypothetical protein